MVIKCRLFLIISAELSILKNKR